MTDPLPKYDAPPVIETVLCAQFARLANFTGAVAGWFWKGRLGSDWTKTKTAVRLEDQFERFGEERRPELPGIRFYSGDQPDRTQIIRSDEERMIQIQDSRFILNWRRGTGGYPSYEKLLPEFRGSFQKFSGFAAEADLGEIQVNQWEVAYVNTLDKGEMWESPADWPTILPGLYTPLTWGTGPIETHNGEWKFVIGKDRGRLYVSLKHGRTSMDGPDTLFLQLTARGPVDAERDQTLEDGLNIGHEVIVRSFTAMTSPEAHKHWKRRC